MNKKVFSIVVPIYFNELNIPHTIPRLQKLQELIPDYKMEFIFVDDYSEDNSVTLLKEFQKKDKRIVIIKLSKNFGSMPAIQAGLHYATGDFVGIITADMQDPPELFVDMIGKWKEGNKVVIATRKDREESFIQKFFSNTYYFLLNKFALKGYPKGGFDFVLLDKQVVNEIDKINEKNTNIMNLIFWSGYKRAYILYIRRRREHGKSKWTFSKKVKLFTDSFISFSYMPIRIISVIGIIVALLSFLYGIISIINKLTGKIPIKGWTTLIVVITFLLGLVMIILGIIGEYLWRILDENKKRPNYIVDEVIRNKQKDKK